MTEQVYIGLGSNLGQPAEQLRQALQAMAQLPHTQLLKTSSLYSSAPLGPADQPRYTNAVALLETALEPLQLLDALQAIEQDHGRVRTGERWGPRTLDLDILLFGNEVIAHERLQVPHYQMHLRPFVLYPLAELAAASLLLPDGRALIDILMHCPQDSSLHRLSP